MILSIAISPSLIDNSFAQQMTPHQQWKKFADTDMMTCKSGYLLLQKSNGNPACVMPSTYLKLVDRGYGNHNQSLMDKNPEMMTHLMNSMASNEKVMHHWHEMLQKNPTMMMQTMDGWVLQIKDNPDLLKNMLAPMTTDPELREKMIHTMKNHPQMENHLKSHSAWMDSVHQPMTTGMGHGSDSMMMDGGMCGGKSDGMKNHTKSMSCSMDHNDSKMGCPMCEKMHEQRLANCPWCPDYKHHSMSSHSMNSHSMTMSSSNKMMDMIHHVWINSEMTKDMHAMMIEDPSHMAMMSNQMMEPMLNAVMDDADLREQMIELMLEHKDFMNSIRHDNPETEH